MRPKILRTKWRLLFLLFLVSCQPAPEPTPQPTQEPEQRPPSTESSYLPLVTSRPCNESGKRAVALAYHELGMPHELLCLNSETTLYHTWGVVGGKTEIGNKISVVWAASKNGFDYVRAFEEYVGGRALTDFVLFANEPDRPDQADMTEEEVARLFLDLVDICPTCRFVGPMYSAADNGRKVAEVWDIVGELCGSPCPAVGALYAHSLHVYPRPTLNYGPSGRIDDLCNLVDGGDCLRPVWITEMGWRTCFPGARSGFGNWLKQAENDPRIEYYFVYTTYQEPKDDCYFAPLLQWESWESGPVLDEMGLAWRDVAGE